MKLIDSRKSLFDPLHFSSELYVIEHVYEFKCENLSLPVVFIKPRHF